MYTVDTYILLQQFFRDVVKATGIQMNLNPISILIVADTVTVEVLIFYYNDNVHIHFALFFVYSHNGEEILDHG